MLEKIYNYANYSLSEEEKQSPSTPRNLTKDEQAVALRLLPMYFKDSEEQIEKLVETMQIVPKRICGSTFFTTKTYEFIKQQFKSYPELMRQIKAEYFSNLLGMDWQVATEYVQNIEKLRTILENKTQSSRIKLSDFDFKMDYTKEDLEKARAEKRYYEDIEDREGDKCLPYGRESDTYLRAKEDVARATEECTKIERAMEFGELIEKNPIKSATEEYKKTKENTIR